MQTAANYIHKEELTTRINQEHKPNKPRRSNPQPALEQKANIWILQQTIRTNQGKWLNK